MSSIRLNAISIDNSPLIIENGTILISDNTKSMSSMTGSLVLNGGIGINCSVDSISSTCGGAVTIEGGLGVKSQTFLGNNLTLDSHLSKLRINGIIHDRFFLDDVNNKQLYISLDGMNKHVILTPDSYILNVTKGSLNSSTGSFVVFGGVGINCTTNATSITSGGALTISGGLSVAKDSFFGNNMFIENTLNVENIASESLYIENTNTITVTSNNILLSSNTLSYNNILEIGNNLFKINTPILFTNSVSNTLSAYGEINLYSTTESVNITTGALLIAGGVGIKKDVNIGGDLIVNSEILLNTSGNISVSNGNMVFTANDGFTFESQSVFIKSGLLDLNTFDFNAQGTNLYIQSLNGESNLNLYTFTGNNTDNNILNIYAKGTPSSLVNTELLQFGYDKNVQTFKINIQKNGSGLLRDFSLNNSNGYLTLLTSGSIEISDNVNVLSSLYINSFLNVTGESLLNGNVSMGSNLNISQTVFALGISSSNLKTDNISVGTLKISGNITLPGSKMISIDTGDVFQYSNNTVGHYSVSWQNEAAVIDGPLCYLASYGGLRFFTLGQNRMNIMANGNVGIRTTAPGYSLDVNGTVGAVEFTGSNAQLSGIMSAGTLISSSVCTGSVVCNSILNATNLSSASLIVNGGISIVKDLYMDGMLTCNTRGSFTDLSILNTLKVLGTMTTGSIYVSGNSTFNGDSNLYNSINMRNVTDIINVYDSNNNVRFTLDYDTNNSNLSFDRFDQYGNFVEHTMTLTNDSGITIFGNTTPSLYNNASMILSGGLRINCSTDAYNISNGGALTVVGGMSVGKTALFKSDVTIESNTDSSNYASGALVVAGGVGITKNLSLGGDMIITGNLTVNGTTTTVNTEITTLNNNTITLDAGAGSSHDAGLIIKRSQSDNNAGSGDVVNDTPNVIDVLPIQTGVASNTIKLSNLASSIDDYYKNWWIKVQSGFSANQVRKITAYNGTTKIATVSSNWNVQNPAGNDTVYLYNRPFVGFIFNEVLKKFQFGSTVDDPEINFVSLSNTLGFVAESMTLDGTQSSINSTTGTLIMSGGLSISTIENATSNTRGGALTVAGGAAINKSLYVGENAYINNVKITPNSYDIPSSVIFSPLNNTLDQTFLTINNTVLSFDIFLGCVIVMTNTNDNMYCNFHIRGINKSTSWEIITDYVGDDTGIEFDIVNENITSNGLLQYSTPDYGPTIVSITFKYKMTTN